MCSEREQIFNELTPLQKLTVTPESLKCIFPQQADLRYIYIRAPKGITSQPNGGVPGTTIRGAPTYTA